MAQMTLYRVEDRMGFGPYYDTGAVRQICYDFNLDFSDHCRPRPGPHDEPNFFDFFWATKNGKRLENYHFAFAHRYQCAKWFAPPKLLRGLDTRGFALSLYRADEENVIVGRAQVLFLKQKATLMQCLPLLDLIKS
jgi:hypothetical protein